MRLLTQLTLVRSSLPVTKFFSSTLKGETKLYLASIQILPTCYDQL